MPLWPRPHRFEDEARVDEPCERSGNSPSSWGNGSAFWPRRTGGGSSMPCFSPKYRAKASDGFRPRSVVVHLSCIRRRPSSSIDTPVRRASRQSQDLSPGSMSRTVMLEFMSLVPVRSTVCTQLIEPVHRSRPFHSSSDGVRCPSFATRRASSRSSRLRRNGVSLTHAPISAAVLPQPRHHLVLGSSRQTSTQGDCARFALRVMEEPLQ